MTTAEAVRAMFAAFKTGGVEGALNHFAPDAVLEIGPETSAEPDTYEGPEGGRRYFAGFEGALEDVRFELLDVHEEEGNRLVADVKLSGVGAATRIRVEQKTRMLFEAAPDGRIERVVALGPTPE